MLTLRNTGILTLGEECLTEQPGLSWNVPYSFLALESKSSEYSHSEMDFGSLHW